MEFTLEEMKAQYESLNKKMEKQNIVTENLLKKGMKRSRTFIKRLIVFEWILVVIGAITWLGISNFMGLSKAFSITTCFFIALDVVCDTIINRRILSKNFYHQPLVEIVKQSAETKRIMQYSFFIGCALLVPWACWLMYELYSMAGANSAIPSEITYGSMGGAIIGLIIAIIILPIIYKKVMGSYNEIIENVKELEELEK